MLMILCKFTTVSSNMIFRITIDFIVVNKNLDTYIRDLIKKY